MGPKSLYLATPRVQLPRRGGFSWDDLREIFNGCQRMAKVPNGVETLPKISNV